MCHVDSNITQGKSRYIERASNLFKVMELVNDRGAFKSGASSYSQSPVLLVKQLQCLKLLGKAGGSGAFWFVLINKKKKHVYNRGFEARCCGICLYTQNLEGRGRRIFE